MTLRALPHGVGIRPQSWGPPARVLRPRGWQIGPPPWRWRRTTRLESRTELWGPGRGHSAPEGAAPIRAGVWVPVLPLPSACLYKMNSQDFTGFLNPRAALYGPGPRSYGRHCRRARHVLKEAGPSSAHRSQAVCGSTPPTTWSRSWVPQRWGATPKGGPSPGPARDASVAAQVYGAFPGPRLYWPSTLPCEHCVIVLKGTPLHEKAGS